MDTSRKEHGVPWLSDGNIVLATDTLLFRVHKGVLSLHSTVFQDMFDLPVEDTSFSSTEAHAEARVIRPDLYDGLPMVMLSGDKGEDVAHLLRAVYERGYYDREDDSTPLDKIIALLSLSAKYDVATVRSDVIKQLARNYPGTLAQYEAVVTDDNNDNKNMLFGRTREECHFPLLRATAVTSQQKDIQTILPTLFYACSNRRIDEIIKNELPLLPVPTLQALLLGERTLSSTIRYWLTSAIDSTSPASGCPYSANPSVCSTKRRFPQTNAMTRMFGTTVFSEIRGDIVADVFFERRCAQCRARIVDILEHTRRKLWEQLPIAFYLEKWDAVRA